MSQPVFAPGWRFSVFDGFVLVAGISASIGFGAFVWWIGFVIAFTIAHFFLFCNVFRMSRPLELVWAAAFVLLCSATIAFEAPGWLLTAAISLAVTSIVVIVEMRKPSYHGIGWQKINPGLQAWWESQFPRADPTLQTGRIGKPWTLKCGSHVLGSVTWNDAENWHNYGRLKPGPDYGQYRDLLEEHLRLDRAKENAQSDDEIGAAIDRFDAAQTQIDELDLYFEDSQSGEITRIHDFHLEGDDFAVYWRFRHD